MSKQIRRRFTGSEKTEAVKRHHLVDKIAVSDLCEELGLQPTQFYQWQKQLFENGARAFDTAGKNGSETRIADLGSIADASQYHCGRTAGEVSGMLFAETEHRERLAGSRGRQ